MRYKWTQASLKAYLADVRRSTADRAAKYGCGYFVLNPHVIGLDKPVELADPIEPAELAEPVAVATFDDPRIQQAYADCFATIARRARGVSYANRVRVIVLIKGGYAVSAVCRKFGVEAPAPAENTDLDVCVAIDPSVPPDVFARVHSECLRAVHDALCLVKCELDEKFFGDEPARGSRTGSRRCAVILRRDDGTSVYVSVSFLPGVRRKIKVTPFFVTVNDTIKDQGYRSFHLARLKCTNTSLIDVAVPDRTDAWLNAFYREGSRVVKAGQFTVPALPSMIAEVYNLLHVYEGVDDTKADRRVEQLRVLRDLLKDAGGPPKAGPPKPGSLKTGADLADTNMGTDGTGPNNEPTREQGRLSVGRPSFAQIVCGRGPLGPGVTQAPVNG